MIGKKTVSMCSSSEYCRGWNDAVDEMQTWHNVLVEEPGEDGSYIICTENGKVCVAHWYGKTGFFSGPAGRLALYWMPLPEAPKFTWGGVNHGAVQE